MKFQVLMATMYQNRDDIKGLMENSGLCCDVLLVNQAKENCTYTLMNDTQRIDVVERSERGLSKSRNCALHHSTADICLIADDDMHYVNDLEPLILQAFADHPEYDLIAFYIDRDESFAQKQMGKQRSIGKFSSLALMSVQIAFRRSRILAQQIAFDERFGAGSGCFICGEENIFLMDCLAKGLRIGYIPLLIGATTENESSWFQGYNDRYFISKGAAFERLFPILSLFVIAVFAILKRSIYRDEITMMHAFKYMLEGRKKIRR